MTQASIFDSRQWKWMAVFQDYCQRAHGYTNARPVLFTLVCLVLGRELHVFLCFLSYARFIASFCSGAWFRCHSFLFFKFRTCVLGAFQVPTWSLAFRQARFVSTGVLITHQIPFGTPIAVKRRLTFQLECLPKPSGVSATCRPVCQFRAG